jgi:hypothetical protein
MTPAVSEPKRAQICCKTAQPIPTVGAQHSGCKAGKTRAQQ